MWMAKLLIIAIAATIIASVVGVYAYEGIARSTSSSSTASPSQINNTPSPVSQITWVGPHDFKLAQNTTSLSVASGSSVSGTIPVQVLNKTLTIFYLADEGFNTTKSVLPTGISVSLQPYGKQYQPLHSSQIGANSSQLATIPAVATTIGNTTIPFTISVASDVPAGTYNVKIGIASLIKNPIDPTKIGTHESRVFGVNLNVT
jgi:hypothetical protein